MPSLPSTIALVAGASRGVGRGIARALGEAGATVYVTGRTLKSARRRDAPGSIDETASDVTAAGGRGIAVQADHTRVEDVRALIDGIRQREGRLDVLVNAVWGGNEVGIAVQPFWEQPLALWDATMRAGVWAAQLTTRFASPLLIRTAERGGQPLVVTVSFDDGERYTGHLAYDLAKAALNRLAFGMSEDLRPHGVASVALSPGFVRTERVLSAFGTSERRWKSKPELKQSESPLYAGRAVVALAADPNVMDRSGLTLHAGSLARTYGFTDVDGRQPSRFVLPDPD
ncbi:MAG: SDR family NAD(P)-dependent oxidoreductase [Bacteroidota bacterium]